MHAKPASCGLLLSGALSGLQGCARTGALNTRMSGVLPSLPLGRDAQEPQHQASFFLHPDLRSPP